MHTLKQFIKHVLEGRTDAFDVSMLAKRHFGSATQITKNDDGSSFVKPEKLNHSTLAGFMAELKKLQATASFDKETQMFKVVQNDS